MAALFDCRVHLLGSRKIQTQNQIGRSKSDGESDVAFNGRANSIQLEAIQRRIDIRPSGLIVPFCEELAWAQAAKSVVIINEIAEREACWKTFWSESSITAHVVVDQRLIDLGAGA